MEIVVGWRNPREGAAVPSPPRKRGPILGSLDFRMDPRYRGVTIRRTEFALTHRSDSIPISDNTYPSQNSRKPAPLISRESPGAFPNTLWVDPFQRVVRYRACQNVTLGSLTGRYGNGLQTQAEIAVDCASASDPSSRARSRAATPHGRTHVQPSKRFSSGSAPEPAGPAQQDGLGDGRSPWMTIARRKLRQRQGPLQTGRGRST